MGKRVCQDDCGMIHSIAIEKEILVGPAIGHFGGGGLEIQEQRTWWLRSVRVKQALFY